MTDFILDAINAAGLKFEARILKPDHYACTLTSPHSVMKRNIQMKPNREPPNIGGVLYHYTLIAQNINEYDDILDWAKDVDRDPGESAALKDFKQMVEDERDLRLLLSEPVFTNLMAGLAISQAIQNAMPR